MAITLTDEMLEILQGLEKGEARMFLKGIQLAQGAGAGVGVGVGVDKQPAPAQVPVAMPKKASAGEGPGHQSSTYQRNRGAQAEILRALFTGPASYIQLQEALRYGRELVVHTLARLEKEGYLSLLRSVNGTELWQLTPKGRHLAAYYVANPGLKVLNPQHRARLAKEGKG